MKRFFRFGRAKDVAREVDDEIAFHLEQLTCALIEGGMAPAEAREEALRRLGDIDAVRDDLVRVDRRDAARRSLLERCHDWALDVRFGVRALARAPGMTITVVLLLALGIGANTAIFGIIDHLLLRPPPHLVDPGQLVRIAIELHWASGQTLEQTAAGYPDLAEYAHVAAFSSFAGYVGPSPVKFGPDSATEVMQSVATPSYFRTLGTPAMLGRTFDSSDASGGPVAVIGYQFWRSRLGGVQTALGQRIMVDGRDYTVIGVMPQGFSGVEASATDVWTMAEQSGLPPTWLTLREMSIWFMLARLKTGVSPGAAASQVEAVRAAAQMPPTRMPAIVHLVSIVPGRTSLRFDRGVRLSVMVGIVGVLLLLITIANVTHVLVVRAMAREREFAVRIALGAGWRRVMRLVLVESGLLAGLGGALALAVALGAGYAFRALLLPTYRWATSPVGLAGGMVAAALALVIALATGALPALLARRRDTVAALRTGMQTGRGWRVGLRLPLIAGQVAISVVLVGGASLFALSLARIGTADHGLDLRHMLDTPLTLDSGPSWRQQLDAIESAASRVAGVTGVTASQDAPYRSWVVFVVRAAPADSPVGTIAIPADRNFFRASGLRILKGRAFGDEDVAGAEPVVVVNEPLAKKLWHGDSPVGRCLYSNNIASMHCVRVIGVSATSTIAGLSEEYIQKPQAYYPLSQQWSLAYQPHSVELLVRTAGDPDQVLDQVRRAIEPLVPDHKVVLKSYRTLMQSDIRPWRVGALLLGIAATLAAVLTAVGLYAVMAFSVRQRYHELGVRRALGAQARHIMRVVVARSWIVVGIGAALGVAGLLYAGRYIAPLLFETSPRDPLAFTWPVIALVGTAAVASVIPALTALRISPRDALQAD